jgi:hypothetical protein
MSKIVLTSNVNSSFDIKLRFLAAFKFLIFTFLFHSCWFPFAHHFKSQLRWRQKNYHYCRALWLVLQDFYFNPHLVIIIYKWFKVFKCIEDRWKPLDLRELEGVFVLNILTSYIWHPSYLTSFKTFLESYSFTTSSNVPAFHHIKMLPSQTFLH